MHILLFQAKLDTEWRIIAKDTNYNNPYINTYTSINSYYENYA